MEKNVVSKISCEVLLYHFKKLNETVDGNTDGDDYLYFDNLPDNNGALNAPFTVQEIKKIISTLKNDKSPSNKMNFDNILNEYLKYADKRYITL